jgi:alkylation response protein AidB-like acyl-CoA dehydrogenase
MDLLPTPEQDEITASIQAVLADRHTLGQPMSDELWTTAADQGWFGLGVAEADGGVGYSMVEEALLCIELGRAAVPGPFLGTILAAAADDPDLRAAVIAGQHRVGLAEREGDHVRVFDSTEGGLAYLIDDTSVGTIGALAEETSLDPLITLGTTAELTGGGPAGDRHRTVLLIAASLAGMAAATTAQSVSYGMDREQFGQPVGGFQAVKHRCADMAVKSEAALTQVHYAALTLRDGGSDAAFQVEAAAVVAAKAAVENAEINIQNHGGIGFTWEHTAHRYVTRSRIVAALGGGLRGHLADLLAAPIA